MSEAIRCTHFATARCVRRAGHDGLCKPPIGLPDRPLVKPRVLWLMVCAIACMVGWVMRDDPTYLVASMVAAAGVAVAEAIVKAANR